MSTPKHHNKTLVKQGARQNRAPAAPQKGAPAQEAVGLLKPDPLADARGRRPRKNPRTQAACQGTDACGTEPRKSPRYPDHLPGVEADACGTAPRKSPRSALSGVEADACGTGPRKNPRSALPGVEADACGAAPRKSPRAQATYQDTDARGLQTAEDFPPRRARPKAQGPTPQPTPLPVPHVSPSLSRLSTDSPRHRMAR